MMPKQTFARVTFHLTIKIKHTSRNRMEDGFLVKMLREISLEVSFSGACLLKNGFVNKLRNFYD